ncbi:hypothetical protein MIR68_010211 [Amoeboaphelidium protococcarum]|nr:hypothetical protein MIR68_010211 [Amoeboaphelidium protococcarum]
MYVYVIIKRTVLALDELTALQIKVENDSNPLWKLPYCLKVCICAIVGCGAEVNS